MSDREIVDALKAVAQDQAPDEFWELLEQEMAAGVALDDIGDIVGEILFNILVYALTPVEDFEKHGSHNQQSHAGGRGGARPEGAIDVQVGYKGLTAKGARFVTEEAEKRGLSMKALEENYAARIEMAKGMDDPYRPGLDAYEGGMTWYAAAGKKAVEVGDGDPAKGAAVLSALSPQNPWPANVRAAEMVADMRRRKDELGLSGDDLDGAWAYYQANHSAFGKGTKGGCGPVTKPNFDMAWKIANGAPISSTLTGRKRQNFHNNILGDSKGVTVDVHMAKGMSMTPGSKVTGKKAAEAYLTVRGTTTGGAGYTFAAQAITNVANRYGIEPAQAQAIIWNTYVQVPWPKGGSDE